MSEKKIFAALGAVMAEVGAIEKLKKNTDQNYKFRGIDDVFNALHPLFAKARIVLACEFLGQEERDKQTRNGGSMILRLARFNIRLISTEDGSELLIPAIGESADIGDKAIHKAQSMAIKYTLLALFAIPTIDEDGDEQKPEWGDRDQKPAAQQQKAAAQQQKAPAGSPITKQQLEALNARLDAVGIDKAKFCAFLGVSSLAEILSSSLAAVNATIDKKAAAKKAQAEAAAGGE